MNALKPALTMPAMIYLLAIVLAATFGCGDPRISIPDAAGTGYQTRRPSDSALNPTTPTIIDLGHVVQGSAIRRTVTIQNSGNSRWVVDHVWTSCECLTFKGLTERVPPGGSLSGGPHPGVCVFVFCDGSVRDISYSIEPEVHRRLGNRQDGEIVDEALLK